MNRHTHYGTFNHRNQCRRITKFGYRTSARHILNHLRLFTGTSAYGQCAFGGVRDTETSLACKSNPFKHAIERNRYDKICVWMRCVDSVVSLLCLHHPIAQGPSETTSAKKLGDRQIDSPMLILTEFSCFLRALQLLCPVICGGLASSLGLGWRFH